MPGAALLVRLFLPFSVGYFASVLLRNVNAVAAPELVREFSLNAADLGFLTSLYFITFTAAQLPLGSLLDRFDSARINAIAMMAAAAGTLVFALAQSAWQLGVGRGLIGLGVAICLMSSLRAFAIWLPANRQPLANGIMFAVGTVGAIVATVPAQQALAAFGWRAMFIGCAAVIALAVALLLVVTPSCRSTGGGSKPVSLREALAFVWRTQQARHAFPAVAFATGVLWAVQSLWAGPWLQHVARLERDALASVLLTMPLGMLAGNLFHGYVSGRLRAAGRDAFAYNRWMLLAFAATLIPFVLQWRAGLPLLCFAFSFFGAATNSYFALLSPYYPPAIVGRANAALNMGMFGSIFAVQWAIGGVVNQFRDGAAYSATGFSTAFGAVFVMLLLLLVWLWPARESAGERP